MSLRAQAAAPMNPPSENRKAIAMRRKIVIDEISIMNKVDACAHSCKYCLTGSNKLSRVGYDRFSAAIERFISWRDTHRPDLKMICSTLYSAEIDLETQSKFMKLRERLQRPARYLLMGGLRMRSEAEMRDWLTQRRDIGVDAVIVSFAGMDAVHDHWNGRKGDFAFLASALKIAGELGMNLSERLFLVRSTLPHLEALIDHLDTIPGKVVDRTVVPFLYRGRAVHLEDERITEDIRDSLPEHLKQLASWVLGTWRDWLSEREWIKAVRQQEEQPRTVRLPIQLDHSNIDRIETINIEDLIVEMEERTMAAYASIPSISELCERDADPTNRRIYTNRDDIERKWLDHHLAKFPSSLERQLTYLAVGG